CARFLYVFPLLPPVPQCTSISTRFPYTTLFRSALAGYFGGWVDEIVMRTADLFFAFPTILLAMVVVAALGPGLFHAVIAVAAITDRKSTRLNSSHGSISYAVFCLTQNTQASD